MKRKIDSNYGINTNVRTKSIMVSSLYDYLVENPKAAKSSDFISQLNIIERKSNGSISAQYGKHDDLFMAAALCAYVRRISALDIEPLLGLSTFENQQLYTDPYKQVLDIGKKDYVDIANNMVYNENEGGYEYNDTIIEDITSDDLPFSVF